MPVQQTTIEVPADLMTEIDWLVGPAHRNEFVVDLARRKIKRQKLLKALESSEPIWRDEDHPEFADGSDAWVEKMRAQGEAHFQRMQRESA